MNYSDLLSEKFSQENLVIRNFLRDLNMKGINDRQRWFLIYLLGLEISNVEEMQTIAAFVKDMRPDATSIAAALEKYDQENNQT